MCFINWAMCGRIHAMRFKNTKNQGKQNKLKEKYAAFCDKVLLGCLFFATCIPVVTIGASVAALFYAVTKVINNDEGYLFKSYMKAWKDNMKQGIVLTLCVALYAGIGAADVYLVSGMVGVGTLPPIASSIVWVFFLPLVLCLPWIFLYMSRFSDSIGTIIKNSFRISVSNPGTTLLLDLIIAIFVIMVLFILPLVPFTVTYLCQWASGKVEPVFYEIAKNSPGFDENAWYGRGGEEN